MGAGCAKSYQTEKLMRTKQLMFSTFQDSKNNRFIIAVKEWQANSLMSLIPLEENAISYLTEIYDGQSLKKFTSKVGFQKCQKLPMLKNDQVLFRFLRTDTNDAIIEIKQSEQNNKKIWKKVNVFGFPLLINDEVKLGENIMKLIYFLNQDQIRAMQGGNEEIQIKQVRASSEQVCRLCLMKQKDSPFILPCLCDNSKIIHQNCLSIQIFDQTVTLDDFKTAFRFVVKKTKCQFCNQSLQTYIWKRLMANMTLREGYYAIFQRKVSSQMNSLEHTQYLILRFIAQNQQFKIGRSKQCDYLIPQDDLDKVHSTISVKNGGLYIFDNNSKNGTYVEQKGNELKVKEEYLVGNMKINIKLDSKISSCMPNLKKCQSQANFRKLRA